MLDVFSLIALVGAGLALGALAWIDLRTHLLPNTLVLGFAALCALFHLCTLFAYGEPLDLAAGAALGGGLLLALRQAGNFLYKQDTLGLGDVKLMAAAGLGLGSDHVLIALIAGALAGVVHGAIVFLSAQRRTAAPISLSALSVPAGPGFVVGILLAALAKSGWLPHLAL